MRITTLLLVLFACTALTTGCASRSGPSDKELGLEHQDLIGYYEVPHEGALYIFGSLKSADAFRAGKPVNTASSGFSAQGRPVYVEADAMGLASRLTAEYQRRHSYSQ